MGRERTVFIVLPVVFLLSSASWAATLGGLEGECNRQGVEKTNALTVENPPISPFCSTYRKECVRF